MRHALTLALSGLALMAGSPALAAPCTCGVAGQIPLCTAADLGAIAANPFGDFRLCNDIVVGAFTPVPGVWNGTLDGGGHALVDVAIDTPTADATGFFRQLGPSSQVRRLTFARPTIRGGDTTGTLAGVSSGRVEDVWIVGGDVLGQNDTGGALGRSEANQVSRVSVVDANVLGGARTGGVVGFCSSANLSSLAVSGVVDGNYDVGGVTGLGDGCSVSSATVSGTVHGGWQVGGIYGRVAFSLAEKVAVYAWVNGGSDYGGGIVGWAYSTWINDAVTYGPVPGAWSGIVRNGVLSTVQVNRSLAICGNDPCAITAGGALSSSPETSFFLKRSGDPNAPIYAHRARDILQLQTLSTYTAAGWSIAPSGTTTTWNISPGSLPNLSFDRVCGNGKVSGSEECDDGNATNGDGCSASCRVEYCGNGRVDPGEQCDDGNADDLDACRSTCVLSVCGDRVVSHTEDCDDGNLVGMDGCASNCGLEQRPVASWLGTSFNASGQGMSRSQTVGIRIRFERPGVVTALGARNTVTNQWRYVNLYGPNGTWASSTTFVQGTAGQTTYKAVTPVRVQAGVVYTLAIPNWGGEYVAFVPSSSFAPPVAAGAVEILGAVATQGTAFPSQTVTQAPIVDLIYAPDP